MSKSINRAHIIGRLGSDPELKYTPQGQAVCSMTVATDESYKDKSGQMVNRVEWHRIVLWRFLAENAGKYLEKGSQVYIEGKLQTRSWDKDGQKHYMTEIVASDVTFLGGKSDSNQVHYESKSVENATQQPNFDIPDTDFDDTDLPF